MALGVIPEEVARALSVLKAGGVVAFPTDTLYGLGASILSVPGVERVFQIKERSQTQRLPILLGSIEDLELVAEDIPELAWKFAQRFWPGPLTLVLQRSRYVPEVVTGGQDTVAVRVPDHPIPRTLAQELGAPITGTSANKTGGPDPITAWDVQQQLGPKVDLIIDGGPRPKGRGSTIVNLTVDPPEVLRQGALHLAPLRMVGHVTVPAAGVAG